MSDMTPPQLARYMMEQESKGESASSIVAGAFSQIGPTPHEGDSTIAAIERTSDAFNQIQPRANVNAPPGDPVAEGFSAIPGNNPSVARFDAIQAARGQTAESFAAIPPKTVAHFFDGTTVPFRGMFSALAPHTLQPGQFSVVQDLRPDDNSLVARQPTTDNSAAFNYPVVTNSNFSSVGSPRGFFAGMLNNLPFMVGAWFNGTSGTNANGVGIYGSYDGVNWTEVTNVSGAFGQGSTPNNSRMTDTGLPFTFATINNPVDGLDYLVVQNNTDAPRVYGSTNLYGYSTRVIQQYDYPSWAEQTSPQGYLNLSNLTTLNTVTSSDANIVNAIIGTGSQVQLSLQVKTTVVSATSNVIIDFGAGGLTGVFGQPQLLFVSDQATANLWNSWKVEISNSSSFATTYVVSDPSSSTYYAPTRVPFTNTAFGGTNATGGLNGEEIVAFQLTQFSNVTNATALRYMRLTWIGPAPAANTTTYIHAVGSSGSEPAFQQSFCISYSGLGGLSESAGVVLQPPGALTTTPITSLPTVYAPYVAGIYYDYFISVQVPALSDLKKGCDTINVYRQDYGSSDYFFFLSNTVGNYNAGAGGWIYVQTGTQTPPTFTQIQLTSSEYQFTALNINRYAPDAYCTCMPIGNAMVTGNNRLFIGGTSYYAISELGQPCRYRPVADPTIVRSAVNTPLPGETVQAFASTAAGSLGANTVFVFSNVRTRVLSGFDSNSLSQPQGDFSIGCSAPGSVAVYRDAIFWLDDNQQIRRFSYGRSNLYGYTGNNAYDLAPAISKKVVSDRTTAIPVSRLPWITGLAVYDRYYLAYTLSGGTSNTRILVWDETVGYFVEDTLSTGVAAMITPQLASSRPILMQGIDGHVYQHETPGSSTAHTVSVTLRELSDGLWNPLFFGRIGVVIDRAASSQTMTITKTLKPVGATDSSTIDLYTLPVNQSGVAQQWRWDSRSSSTQPGLGGVSSQAAMSWTMTPGTRLYAIVQEIQKANPGADQT